MLPIVEIHSLAFAFPVNFLPSYRRRIGQINIPNITASTSLLKITPKNNPIASPQRPLNKIYIISIKIIAMHLALAVLKMSTYHNTQMNT